MIEYKTPTLEFPYGTVIIYSYVIDIYDKIIIYGPNHLYKSY